MSYTRDFDIFVGGKTGIFKGVKLNEKSFIKKNIQSLMAITDDHEITAMSWGDDEEKEILIGCGARKLRSVKIYDTEYSAFTSSFNCEIGKGNIIGISRYDDAVLTAVASGHVKLWRYDENEQLLIKAGEDLHRMRHSRVDKNIIATGGENNDLRLFDLEKQERVFNAKNVPHDSLELRVPVWVSDIGFMPGTPQVVTTSKYGHIRLYDPRSQRRPMINLQIQDEALTTLATTSKEKHIVVGSGKGRMNLIDLRKPGKILNTYKDFVGSITSIACSNTQPLIASVGLDRYLRLHNLDTKELIKKDYLTSRINCMLLRSNYSYKVDGENCENVDKNTNVDEKENRLEANGNSSVECIDMKSDSETEYDAMFDGMPVIANEEDEANFPENQKKYPTKKPVILDSTVDLASDETDNEQEEVPPPKKLKKSNKKTKFG